MDRTVSVPVVPMLINGIVIGYSAYDKLSPDFRKILDGKTAIYRSAHQYLNRDDPSAGPKYVEREHPIVRVHPATGWKSLWVNRAMTVRIVGLDKPESGKPITSSRVLKLC